MDGDGKISVQDFRENYKKHDEEVDEETIKYYMQWDKDKDGCLSLEEFRKMSKGDLSWFYLI